MDLNFLYNSFDPNAYKLEDIKKIYLQKILFKINPIFVK